MIPIYEEKPDSLEVFTKNSSHISPHLHKSIEFVLVTEGTLELGIGVELYHMEKGDFAIVFPNLIHHYQIFDKGICKSAYILASPSLSGSFLPLLQQYSPSFPIIPKSDLHPDILYAFHALLKHDIAESQQPVLFSAYLQIILSRSLSAYDLREKETIGTHDIIYNVVSYIAAHFKEHITLPAMAHDLAVTPHTLSKVFSGTFHQNFNQYLNETRLDYVSNLLQYSNLSITEAYENAGFDSQRTFNRVFRDRFHMSPREYRRSFLNNASTQ